MPSSRRLILLAACLLIGALISQVVAMVIGGTRGDLVSPNDPRTTPETAAELWTLAPDDWQADLSTDELFGNTTRRTGLEYAWVFESRQLERPAADFSDDGSETFFVGRLTTGWPLGSARTMLATSAFANPKTDWDHGWEIREDRWFLKAGRVVPLLPVWSGLAINTLFYGALLWLILCGPWETRRRLRQWRGRCVRCGYDLQGSDGKTCPECGPRSS